MNKRSYTQTIINISELMLHFFLLNITINEEVKFNQVVEEEILTVLKIINLRLFPT
jgi:hypothetical protein